MTRSVITLSYVFFFFLASQAQNGRQSSRVTTYKAGNKPEELLSTSIKYRYPGFQPGLVSFRDGTGGAGKLNYNLLLKEIHFIDAKGDTLALDNLPLIKYITIGTDSFFYNKGVLELIENYDNVKLAVKEVLREVDRQKIGAYGMSNAAGSIETYNSIRVNQGTYKLSIAENIVYAKERTYYLIIKENQFLPLNWSNVGKAFPSKRDKIQPFASENKLDLNKETDIKRLLAFCSAKS